MRLVSSFGCRIVTIKQRYDIYQALQYVTLWLGILSNCKNCHMQYMYFLSNKTTFLKINIHTKEFQIFCFPYYQI